MKDSHPRCRRFSSARTVVCVALLTLITAGQAYAGCTVSSPGLAFGLYQPLTFPGKLTSAVVTSTTSVTVVCDPGSGLTYTIALGPSAVGSGDRISTRYLANANGGDFMSFNVFTDAAYSNVWGNTAGNLLSGGLTNGGSQSFTVYGKVAPTSQTGLKAGSFSGSMTMTLTYTP